MITQLKEICALFGLQVSGTKDSLTDALVEFLDAPWDTKKTVKVAIVSNGLTIRQEDHRLRS